MNAKTMTMEFRGADAGSFCADVLQALAFNFSGPVADDCRLRLQVKIPDRFQPADVEAVLHKIAASNGFTMLYLDEGIIFETSLPVEGFMQNSRAGIVGDDLQNIAAVIQGPEES